MTHRICSVEDCDKLATSRQLCKGHYQRLMRSGSIKADIPLGFRPSLEQRFWAKVQKTDGCWLWVGSRDRKGYGRFNVGGAPQLAHRFSYELAKGPIPDSLTLDHLCMNSSCVNPDHLEPVTNEENLRRWRATITHCPKGHPYDEINTYVWRGNRRCRVCIKAHQKRMRAQRIERGGARAH